MHAVQPEREKARLRKLMLRYIGLYWCGLPKNNDPRSVLYKTIISTADLDRMAATLPAACHK